MKGVAESIAKYLSDKMEIMMERMRPANNQIQGNDTPSVVARTERENTEQVNSLLINSEGREGRSNIGSGATAQGNSDDLANHNYGCAFSIN